MLKALDTETTGVDFFHGARPFLVSIAKADYTMVHWQWDVDPRTRRPIIPPEDLITLRQELENPADTIVIHNAKFDVRALHSILPDLDWRALFRRIDDTLLMHHCLDSAESHSLKDSALKYADIPDDDQQTLRVAVEQARTYGRKLGWAIASPKSCPTTTPPKPGWWVMDLWLPRAYLKSLPGNWQDHPWQTVCLDYCNRDVIRTLAVYTIFRQELERTDLWPIYQERRQLLPIVYQMEQRGVSIDLHRVKREILRCEQETDRYGREAGRACGRTRFNPRSDKQVADVLFNHFKLPVTKETRKGRPSTDKDTIFDLLQMASTTDTSLPAGFSPKKTAIRNFLLSLTLAKKHYTAISYLEGYARNAVPIRSAKTGQEWHVLHPNFNITGPRSTRFSSDNPNLQNVSKGKEVFIEEIKEAVAELSLRKVFGPAPQREWWAVDYRQLQLVIFAYASQDKAVIQALENGIDLHEFTQRTIFGSDFSPKDDGQRRVAKAVNFGIIFGAGPSRIEQTAKKPGVYALVMQKLPGVRRFLETNIRFAKQHGYVYAAGYRLTVPPEKPYAATNYIIQGWEGRIVQRAMILCDEYLQSHCPDAYITLQVHDELVFDFPAGAGDVHIANLCELMQSAGRSLSIPCSVDAKYIQASWDQGIPVVIQSEEVLHADRH